MYVLPSFPVILDIEFNCISITPRLLDSRSGCILATGEQSRVLFQRKKQKDLFYFAEGHRSPIICEADIGGFGVCVQGANCFNSVALRS